jgi:hypothetical protein
VLVLLLSCCTRSQCKGCFVMLPKESRQALILLLCKPLSQTKCCHCCYTILGIEIVVILGVKPSAAIVVMLPKESMQVLPLLLRCLKG